MKIQANLIGRAVLLAALAVSSYGHAQTASAPAVATDATSAQSAVAAPAPTDRQIAVAVRAELKRVRREGPLKATVFHVRVKHGAVTLSGNVVDPKQIEIALDTVKQVAGVVSVTPRIRVGPPAGARGGQ